MTGDGFVAAIDEVTAAGRRAADAIIAAVGALEESRQARLEGTPLVEIVERLIALGGRETRLDAADGFLAYERTVASLRAYTVRSLVDDDGRSLTEVASLLRVSRQAAGCLLAAGPKDTVTN